LIFRSSAFNLHALSTTRLLQVNVPAVCRSIFTGVHGVHVKNRRHDRFDSMRQVGYLTTIPFLLLASPLIGYGLGRLLDKLFHTTFLTWVFLVLGVVAGIREVVRVIRRVTYDDPTGKD
jgi:hypothetical protein